PPGFRPAHLKAAVEAGKHIFCEKPVAVDGPGIRSVFETVEQAKQKGLSLVSGLCWRYHPALRATFEQVQNGSIGETVALQCSYFTNGLWHVDRTPEMSGLEWQIRNWLYFTWLSGDHNVEQHVHSLDKMTWAMGDQPPLSATGTGGRQVRTDPKFGHIYDHFAVEYEYPNGVKAFARCRQQDGAQVDVTDHLFGTKGACHIASHRTFIKGEQNWRYTGENGDMYQLEHDALFAGIRNGTPINNGRYMTVSTMMAIMGRMAAYTGQTVTWKQALESKEDLTPSVYSEDLAPPHYPAELDVPQVPMPGLTQFV
ncbi:MAG: Gfo/Idh/MocA family protein, partial [Planctomycetaceae bacterium]